MFPVVTTTELPRGKLQVRPYPLTSGSTSRSHYTSVSSPRGSFFLSHSPRVFPLSWSNPHQEAGFSVTRLPLGTTHGLHLLLRAWFSSWQFCPQMNWGCSYCKGMHRTDNKDMMFPYSPMARKLSGTSAQTPLPMSSPSVPQFTVYTQAVFQCRPYQPSHSPSASNSLSVKWQ